jgi:predicted MFS family arabinose efflux permease
MYGLIQAATPRLLQGRPAPGGIITALVTAIPALVCIGVAVLEWRGGLPPWGMVIMIGIYSSCFAVASAIHSYLIAAYAQAANVSKNIGLYYSANAVGRLCGVLLSGYCYVEWGIIGCVLGAALFCIPAIVCALPLPRPAGTMQISGSTE